MNKKWRNYGLWVSIISQVLLILQLIAPTMGYSITDAMMKEWVLLIDAILGLLVILGVISNPTSGKWFRDFYPQTKSKDLSE